MNTPRRRKRKNQGFTLLEVLLVMAILIILMSLVGAGYFTYFANSQEDAARLQISAIEEAAKGYYLKVGKPPAQIDDLVRLPSGMDKNKWKGPFLEGGQVPLDPWQNKFEMTVNPGASAREMQIIVTSYGPDSQKGTDDDITNARQQQQ